MKIKESDFWKGLKRLMWADDHVAVPAECLDRALAIFEPPQKTMRASLFQLRPAFLGAVRRAGSTSKKFYELEDRVVQLEQTNGEGGEAITGFVHGFDDIPVTLHGSETVFQTSVEAGAFAFEGLPEGRYSLCFSQDGEDSWITGIQVSAQG